MISINDSSRSIARVTRSIRTEPVAGGGSSLRSTAVRLRRALGSSLRRAGVRRTCCLVNPAFAALSFSSITTGVSLARRSVAAIVALRATTASCVFLDSFPTGRAVFFAAMSFLHPAALPSFGQPALNGTAQTLRVSPDTLSRAGHLAPPPASVPGWRFALQPWMLESSLEAKPIPPKIPLGRFYFLRILESKGPSKYKLQWNFNLTFAAGIRGQDGDYQIHSASGRI